MRPVYYLGVFIPAAIALKSGPGIGGLLNVTFGNAPELIIAFFALLEGLQEVVKASIVGSIIGNILLVLGAAMVVGNAAEHWVAVLVAAKNKMDLAVNIAIGSSAQIALFVAPVLVIASFFVGDHPLALIFNGYELGALLFAILIANFVTQEGESNWFEGVQLLALYAVLGLVFYYAE